MDYNNIDASKITALIKLKEKLTVTQFCEKYDVDYYAVRNLSTGLSTGINEGTKTYDALKKLIEQDILPKEYMKAIEEKTKAKEVQYKEIKEKDISQRKDVPALIKIHLDLTVTAYHEQNKDYFEKYKISLIDLNVFNSGQGTGLRKAKSTANPSKAFYIRKKLEEDKLIKPIDKL